MMISKILIYFIDYLMHLFNVYLYEFNIVKFNRLKIEFNYKTFFLNIILSGVFFIFNLFPNIFLKDVIMLISITGIIRIQYKLEWKKIIVSYILLIALMFGFDLIIAVVLNFYDITYLISRILLLREIITIVVLLIIYFSAKLIINWQHYQKIKKIILQNYSIMYSCIIFGIMVIIGVLNFKTYKSNTTYLLFITLLLVIMAMLFTVYKGFRRTQKIKKNNKILIKKNDEYTKYIKNFKTYKHNIKYKLNAVKKYGNKKVNYLIDELIDNNIKEIDYLNNLNNIPNSVLSIIAERLSLYKIDNKNIIIENNLKSDDIVIKGINNYSTLCELMGNMLTNALEALPKENSLLLIQFTNIDDYQYIRIINNFSNEISLEEIGNINYSTKNRESGYGLFFILQCKKFEPKIEIKDNLFIAQIKIPK